MNLGHLRAVLWLRWRILVNRIRRGGKLGNAVLALLLVVVACIMVLAFVGSYVIGIEQATDDDWKPILAMWIVPTILFLFFWSIGLMTDLQRSDAMSFDNLLHLPVSLRWVFVYNYLSSFVAVSIGVFLPSMLGFWTAMVVGGVRGAVLLLPLMLGYFAMITALTYQLRGWLGRLMQDKRRGRNVISIVTIVFVLLLQIPNMINLAVSTGDDDGGERRALLRERDALETALDTTEPDSAEHAEARAALERFNADWKARSDAEDAEVDRIVTLVCQVVPIGWLPHGARRVFEGSMLPALLGTAGYFTIAAFSLRRSYRKTVVAAVDGGPAAAASATVRADVADDGKPKKKPLVERALPFVHDETAGIGFASLQSLIRAPETKMMLLSPVILLGMFGFLLAQNPERGRFSSFAPLMSLGATATGLISIMQLLQNQFGLERQGFRAYVLSPTRRSRILIGKNLSLAPLALGVGAAALVLLQILVPTDAPHFLGAWLQLLSAYLLICLVGNTISILGPMRLKENTFKAEGGQWRTILVQIASILVLPVALAPLALPAGVEFFALSSLEGTALGALAFPAMHALLLACVAVLYRIVVAKQGEFLQDREQHILDLLTRR